MPLSADHKNFLSALLQLDAAQSEFLFNHISYRSYKKDEYIFRAGNICHSVFYMTKGLVRCYYLHDDKEVNLRLICDDSAVLAYSSFIEQKPAQEFIQCLADSEGFEISLKDQDQILAHVPQIESFRRLMAERHYLSMERRLMTLQFKNAEDKYQYFLEHMEPKIVEETPAHHVAYYLGITPESFSRVKRQLKN